MPLFVLRQNLEPCSDSETNYRHEWILEPDPVDVIVPKAIDQLTRPAVAVEKAIQDSGFYVSAGLALLRRTRSFRSGRRFDVVANEPTAEPTRSYLFDYTY